jgi:molybdenum cofactor cytidylyltransferase
MIFSTFAVDDAADCILAHSVRHAEGSFKKGRRLSPDDIAALKKAGVVTVTAARLESTDVHEDEAARLLALACAGEGLLAQQAFTGRANVHVKMSGLAIIDATRIRAINHLHESLTIATLPPYAVVAEKQMLATIKVIPFSTPQSILDRALPIAQQGPLLQVKPFDRKHITLIITKVTQTKASIISKTQDVTADRLAALGLQLSKTEITSHSQNEIASAIAAAHHAGSDLILVFGASAIVDRGDVIPAGLVQAGGHIVHLGMPVDPGNLLMLGRIGNTQVIGVPSCARSPKRNGFDWVLERACAGVMMTPEDLMDMGAGGLLAEIPTRPSPRELQVPAAPRVAAVILAAGFGKRMGGNKMLAHYDGKPMLLATIEAVKASGVDDVIVVTGDDSEAVRATVGAAARLVHNAAYATGMASSLRIGVEAAGPVDAILVCLGDMPAVKPETFDKLIAAFNPVEHRSIVVPVHQGQFGNPVLWGAEHFHRLTGLQGDKGARALIADLKNEATEVAVDDVGVLKDFDTPESLREK